MLGFPATYHCAEDDDVAELLVTFNALTPAGRVAALQAIKGMLTPLD